MNSSPSTTDGASSAFHDYAEAQATATVRDLIALAAKPALTELEALRVAFAARCETLTATLAAANSIDAAPVRELVERLAHAAGEEASAAARAARTLALEEADARLQIERAEAQQQLDALRAEATQERIASQLERAALADTLKKATEQAAVVRAERDAQIEALRVAHEQAEAVRADRDAQVEALRAAHVQTEAIRADRDAQLEALRADRDAQVEALRDARAAAEAVRADRDTQIEARRVATEQADAARADRDAQFAAAEAAKEEARKTQAEQDFLLEAARISNARHTKLLEQARAQVEAAQARVESAEAQLAAAQADAERRIAASTTEIEALRLELERVRASLRSAPTEPIRQPLEGAAAQVEPARPGPAEPVIEPTVVPPIERSVAPAIELVVEPAPEQAASVIVQTVEPAPVAAPAAVDPILGIYRAIGEAADLSQVLDALIDGVGVLFPRAALFVVKTKSKRLQGWRSVGFTGVAAITREFKFPLSTDSALTRAVTANRTIFTGDGQPAMQPAEAWTVTFPVTTGGRVVAVVHADRGGNSDTAPTFDRETALDLGHTLVRMAGERIGALTMSARAAFGNVMNVSPAGVGPSTPAPVNGAAVNGTHVNGEHVNGAQVNEVQQPAAPASLDEASRYAAQLVSEINRYNLVAATAAPAGQGLQERIAGQIGGTSSAAASPAPPAPGNALGMFDEALGKMLGNDVPGSESVVIQPV